MTGDYSSCQPAASTIIDSANPSCSDIWGKYSFPEIIDFYSVITLVINEGLNQQDLSVQNSST